VVSKGKQGAIVDAGRSGSSWIGRSKAVAPRASGRRWVLAMANEGAHVCVDTTGEFHVSRRGGVGVLVAVAMAGLVLGAGPLAMSYASGS